MALEMWESQGQTGDGQQTRDGQQSAEYTFKGHNKKYYEQLRREANEKISLEKDKLEKAELIERYGTELWEAGKYFRVIEIVEMLKDGSIWK